MNSTLAKYAFCALSLLFHSFAACASFLIPGEPQHFIFKDEGHYADSPITVHYYKPRNATADAKVMFAIHGVERNGKRTRDSWISASEKYGVIVIAPEFDRAHFPNKLFQMGGMEESDSAKRSFSIIESIFEKIRHEESLTAQSYMLFGHSAGAQFVHRFVLMMDKPRLSVAVAANAGSYTLPAFPNPATDFGFPWSLDARLIDDAKLGEIFQRRLIVLLGENDIHTDSANFPKSREALAQGANRLERGRNFYARAQSQAQKLGVPLDWRLVTIPGVGHDSREMSKAAARILFEPDNETSPEK